MGIGKRIKEARERLGLTQKQLAQKVGVTASSITNYENETSHPKEQVLYELIKALKVDANFLFQDCFPMPPQISYEARTVALVYDKADQLQKDTVRLVLGMTEVVDSPRTEDGQEKELA